MPDYSKLGAYTDIELVLSLINEKHRTRVLKKRGRGGHHFNLKERQ